VITVFLGNPERERLDSGSSPECEGLKDLDVKGLERDPRSSGQQ
jgi:hypothetical protein